MSTLSGHFTPVEPNAIDLVQYVQLRFFHETPWDVCDAGSVVFWSACGDNRSSDPSIALWRICSQHERAKAPIPLQHHSHSACAGHVDVRAEHSASWTGDITLWATAAGSGQPSIWRHPTHSAINWRESLRPACRRCTTAGSAEFAVRQYTESARTGRVSLWHFTGWPAGDFGQRPLRNSTHHYYPAALPLRKYNKPGATRPGQLFVWQHGGSAHTAKSVWNNYHSAATAGEPIRWWDVAVWEHCPGHAEAADHGRVRNWNNARIVREAAVHAAVSATSPPSSDHP